MPKSNDAQSAACIAISINCVKSPTSYPVAFTHQLVATNSRPRIVSNGSAKSVLLHQV
jgi:hypothetical protein